MSTENKNPAGADIPETDFSALDAELAAMADEAPGVPADFHAKWTAAVRAEAENHAESRPESASEDDLRKAIDTPDDGEADSESRNVRRQLRYILSAAAVFVFLIAGTMVTRSQRAKKAPSAETAPAAVLSSVSSSDAAGAAEEAEYEALDYAEEAAAYEAYEEAAEYDEAAESWNSADAAAPAAGAVLYSAKSAVPNTAAGSAPLPLGTASPTLEPQRLEEPAAAVPITAAEYKAEAGEEPEAETAAAEPEAAQNGENPAEGPDRSEPAEPGFWKDFFDFSAAALPWLLGAGVLAAFLAAIIQSRKNR